MSDVTRILDRVHNGEAKVAEELLPLVYERLRKLAAPLPDDDLLALDEALDRLAALDPVAAELVKLRFFVGVAHAEAAKMLGLSRSGADRAWVFARAWLFQELRADETRARIAQVDLVQGREVQDPASAPWSTERSMLSGESRMEDGSPPWRPSRNMTPNQRCPFCGREAD